MKEIPTPTHVLYHAACRDGFTAAWAISQRFPNATFVPVHYGEKFDMKPYQGKDIIMVDVSLEREDTLALSKTAHSLYVVDHHKTAFEKLSDLPFVFFDMKRSGAGLAWDLFNDGPRPLLVDVVEDRDLWTFTIPNSKDITTVLDTIPQNFQAYDEFSQKLQENPQKIIDEGLAMKRYHLQVCSLMLQEARPLLHGTKKGLAINVPHAFVSDTGSMAVSQNPGVDFTFLWSQLKDGSVRASWRSNGVPVDDLARDFGGGGHVKACGAQMDMDTLLSYLAGSHAPRPTSPKP